MTELRDAARQAGRRVREDLERAAAAALEEDLGGGGAGADVTTTSIVPPELTGEAEVFAKAPGVLCGLEALAATFGLLDSGVDVRAERADGDEIETGDILARIRGPVRAILTGERTALNLLGHLSGIATLTRALVRAAPGVAICDTRKTLPGLRAIQKYAVRTGGGVNHRLSLWDGVLVKDNHIVAAGGTGEAVRRAKAATTLPVQVECSSPEAVQEALQAGADALLLDNLDPVTMGGIVQEVRGAGHRVLVEASGGVTLDRVADIAASGVDRVSVGALTHSAPGLDLSLELVRTT